MMAAMTLYNYELDEASYRVRLFLSILGIAHETIPVNMAPNDEHRSPAMLAISPLGTMPVLKDGDLTLYGAEAILTYLAKAHDPDAAWLPTDPKAFGGVMQWLGFSASALPAATQARNAALFGLPGDFEALKAKARAAFRVMDDHMVLRQIDGMDWFAGPAATLADVTLFPLFALSRDFGIDHDEFPALRLWMRRFRALKGFRTMPGIPDYH